jgi:PAS domain-containing protein
VPYLLIIIALGLLGGWHWLTTERQVSRPPGVTAPEEPVQEMVADLQPVEQAGFRLEKRARYRFTALVLRKEIYRIDAGANLAPVDLGVGWGRMSDPKVVAALEFSQLGRFLYWEPRNRATFPLPLDEVIGSAAQVHAIPAAPHVERRLRSLRPGALISAEGWLVDARAPNGAVWRTSLSRADSGAGACELMLVETLDVQ